jgi:hypothetical protein
LWRSFTVAISLSNPFDVRAGGVSGPGEYLSGSTRGRGVSTPAGTIS